MNFYKLVGLIFSALAFWFSIFSTFTGSWVVIFRNGTWIAGGGHFYACSMEKCVISAEQLMNTYELRTSFAFLLLSIIGFLVSSILIGLGFYNNSRKFFYLGGVLALTSALVELLGLIFFTTQHTVGEKDGHIFKFGYSYALAWVVSFFGLMAGIFSLIESEDGELKLWGRLRIRSLSHSSSIEKV